MSITAVKPTGKGWLGRGGGANELTPVPQEWRGTSVQVCGLYPFAAGSGTPMIGVPLGRHLLTGSTVCCDPISWFQRASLISNPSMFVLGKPGLGKSSSVRHMITGLSGYGVIPLILGDLKPDYVALIRALGGQVISIGRGRGGINPLDTGAAYEAASRLDGQARREILADAHGRRLTMLSVLVQIMRGKPTTDREDTILERCLQVWDKKCEGQIPRICDILEILRSAPDAVRAVSLDRGDIERYRMITEDLEASLVALTGGRFGEIFAEHTSVQMELDKPVVFDVSALDETELDLQAAVLLACWSYGFGSVNIASVLADAGLAPRRHYFVIMDELWRALRAGRGIVDRVDALTRLNRQRGVGQAMITHTMSDLEALSSEEDRAKARGFVERSGMLLCGGLPQSEMPFLRKVVSLSEAEERMLTSWQDPPAWDTLTGKLAAPPGRGKFLIKVGGRPGIPVSVVLTPCELEVNDTNTRWNSDV